MMPTTPRQDQTGYPGCPESALQQKITSLESESIDQDINDKKAKLAEVKKIFGEVDPVEKNYKKDYQHLVDQYEDASDSAQKRKKKIDDNTTEAVRSRIKQIADCEDKRISELRKQWTDARETIPGLQYALADATIQRGDAEEPYREYLKYKAAIEDLGDLKTKSATQIENEDYRGAYFLVEIEMLSILGPHLPPPPPPPVSPDDFNQELESRALEYYKRLDAERAAKTALDQGTADSQKKKKAYEEAETKRRENILKLIGEEPFPAAPAALQDQKSSSPNG